ncbi:MAG: VWA domain-containing protein [Bdellovibrionaceae bacterium]|jgi:Ca-activated chloride channel family protein|nr:VWA domain-containing protein [Pseudobdellovibrionaceae bacterium]
MLGSLRWAESFWAWWIIGVLVVFVLSYHLLVRQFYVWFHKIHPFSRSLMLPIQAFRKVGYQLTGLSLALVFCVFALMRPQTPGDKEPVKSEGVEIVLVADVSESMLAEDLNPNRLTQMKYNLMRLVDLLPGSRFGLVAFAGSAHILSPLTLDPEAIKMYVDALDPSLVSSQGTRLAEAIEAAWEVFKRGSANPEDKGSVAQTTKVIVLLSDGEDHEPEALESAERLLKEYGIHLYAVSYGSVEGARIPQRNDLGYLVGYKKDKKGKEVMTKVNPEVMVKLAQAGQGESYQAGNESKDIMRELASQILQLDKTLRESYVVTSYHEHYAWFLWPALIILLGIFLPSYRSLSFRINKSTSVASLKIWPWFLVIVFAPSAWAEFEKMESWFYYHQAVRNFKAQRSMKAFQSLQNSLVVEPRAFETQNLFGVMAFEKEDQKKQACHVFEISEMMAQNPEEQFIARFNLGACYHSQGEVEPAIEAYLKALEIKPDSKETKINLELLAQQASSSGGQGGNQGKKDEQEKEEPKQYQNPESQKKFQSSEVSEAQMRKILEELKNQEQKVRREFHKGREKSQELEKNW